MIMKYIIDRISSCEDEELKSDIIGKIRLAEDFQKLNLMSDAEEGEVFWTTLEDMKQKNLAYGMKEEMELIK